MNCDKQLCLLIGIGYTPETPMILIEIFTKRLYNISIISNILEVSINERYEQYDLQK